MICPLCESKAHKVHKVIKGVEIFECENCRLGFTKKITNLVRSHQSGSELYDFKEYKKEENKLRRRFERLVKIITKYKNSGKVLDVGAGFGLFSSILQKMRDYQIDIIEPELKYRYIDITISNFFKTTFEKFKAEGKKYDIVVLMDVLEHFRDPLKNLEKAKSLLKKDGILVLQSPNYKSFMAKVCRDWAWWMVEDHKFFFSPKSIKLLLKKAGFEIEYLTTYEDFEDFKKNLDGNFTGLKNDFIRKLMKFIFYLFFASFYFLAREIIWKLNFGGLLFAIAKKS